jgi:DNA-binding protein YbaB
MTRFGMPELDRHLEHLMQAATRMRDMQDRIAEIRGVGEAADGRVRVEADNAGRVCDVQLDPRAMRLASQDLAEAILSASQQAADDVAAQTQELMNELMPADLPMADILKSDLAANLPEDGAEALNTVARGADPAESVAAALAQLRSRMPR